MSAAVLGIDVGGTSIKASFVDLDASHVLDRHELTTPVEATSSNVAAAVREIAARCGLRSGRPVGICLPAVVDKGVVRTAANIDAGWIGLDAVPLFEDLLQSSVSILNDADAAGTAEVSALQPPESRGVVIAVTLGTGLGTALFTDGRLTPNTELGHLRVDDHLADTHVAFSAVRRDHITADIWAARVDGYLALLERLFAPSRFIIGGGGSATYFNAGSRRPSTGVPAVPARFGNDAGIIGAAMAASPQGMHRRHNRTSRS